MTRWIPPLLLLSCCLVACDRSPQPPSGREALRVAADQGVIDPAIAEQFERVTGIHVLVSPDAGDRFDLRIVSGSKAAALARAGRLRSINLADVPNAAHLIERFRPKIDQGGSEEARPATRQVQSLPLTWEAVGLLYRSDLVPHFEPSWAMIFDDAKPSPPFAIPPDDPLLTALALHYLGKADNAADPAARAAAEALVQRSKTAPSRRTHVQDAMLMVVGSATAHRAMVANANLRFAIPTEGSVLLVRVAVIPTDADRPDLAHQFINYLLDPQIAAQLATYTRSATTNDAAMPYIAPQDRADPTLYPPPQIMETLDRLHR